MQKLESNADLIHLRGYWARTAATAHKHRIQLHDISARTAAHTVGLMRLKVLRCAAADTTSLLAMKIALVPTSFESERECQS